MLLHTRKMLGKLTTIHIRMPNIFPFAIAFPFSADPSLQYTYAIANANTQYCAKKSTDIGSSIGLIPPREKMSYCIPGTIFTIASAIREISSIASPARTPDVMNFLVFIRTKTITSFRNLSISLHSYVEKMPFNCEKCGECCRRYWITVLPDELEKEAGFLKIPVREFVNKYTRLYLRLFPMQSEHRKHGLVISSALLPKKVARKAEHILYALPDFFLALPTLAFKRRGKTCIFFDEKKGCEIQEVKPEQCSLFPEISMSGTPLKELYPFCLGLKINGGKRKTELEKNHYQNVFGYFERVGEEGFKKVWKHWPKEGIAVLKGKKLGDISGKEFFEAISATASP